MTHAVWRWNQNWNQVWPAQGLTHLTAGQCASDIPLESYSSHDHHHNILSSFKPCEVGRNKCSHCRLTGRSIADQREKGCSLITHLQTKQNKTTQHKTTSIHISHHIKILLQIDHWSKCKISQAPEFPEENKSKFLCPWIRQRYLKKTPKAHR